MKLWMKISLLCTCVLLLIVGVCSLLLLTQSRNSIMELTRSSAQKQLDDVCTSVLSIVGYFGNDDIDAVAKRSLIRYSFSQYADSSFVLMSGTEKLYSQTGINPDELMSGSLSYEGRYGNRDILIYGKNEFLLGDYYKFYIIKDLSDVNSSVSKLVWEFISVSAVCIALGTLFIIILTRFSTRRLKRLSTVTGSITGGGYGNRALIDSKDEIGMLARDFNIMADSIQKHIDDLKETAERQKLFIGGLTHEFKTPLTSMIIHSETLLYTKLSEGESYRSLSHIHNKCKWLERLTQKLLKLITLREDINIKNEPAGKLLDSVCLDVKEILEARKVELNVSCETEYLPMDIDLMRSAVVNLVINAANASKPGQTVSIRVYDKTIEVTDNGRGISKEEIGRITEPFYMADRSRGKKTGGSGLGLSLVKEIAEAHNAHLAFESEPGRGTTAKIIFQLIACLYNDDYFQLWM